MPPRRHDLAGSSLLAVLAHPDDESLACGGLLALCADAGARVSLLCLTKGENGHSGATREPLGDVRVRELREAARVLGIGEVVLREHEDGMLPWSDAAMLEADVLDAIGRFEPDVVITFDRDGLYWHPDHVAVHERVTAAVARMEAAAPALLYVSMPPGAMRSLVEAAPRGEAHVLGVTAVDAFGSLAPEPTLVVDAGPLAARKLAALGRHRSQVDGSVLDFLDERDAARHLGTEHYRRAEVGARGEAFVERFGRRVAAAGS